MNIIKHASSFAQNNLIIINGIFIILSVLYTHANLEYKHREAESVSRVLIDTREVSLFELISAFIASLCVVYFVFKALARTNASIYNINNKIQKSSVIFTLSILGSLNLIAIYLMREAERRSDLIALANTDQLANYLAPDKLSLVCLFIGIANIFLSLFNNYKGTDKIPSTQ
jgi:hypothetical protein